ncbi:hypothetical protein WJR50_05975 [Catalinimonas sp. 4WD22]|uniref:hypothetical protein n=1 Tax=Catalinimonas locisalis TaxID=3133978 RepID=UPI003100EA3D
MKKSSDSVEVGLWGRSKRLNSCEEADEWLSKTQDKEIQEKLTKIHYFSYMCKYLFALVYYCYNEIEVL